MEIPPLQWALFAAVIGVLLAVDLVVHRGGRGASRRVAAIWTTIWIAAGLGFGLYVWRHFGPQPAREYLAAYLIEKSLSLDNLFVFLVIFQSLRVPLRYQHTVLLWGIFGALLFRAAFIFLGVQAIERWDWVELVFGGILLVTAWRVFRDDPGTKTESKVANWLARHLPFDPNPRNTRFFVRVDGKLRGTPLLLAILAVEFTDVIFAIDSVPAAFAVSREEFVLYTSNAFAILGLRALYLLLACVIGNLPYLHYGLAAVLAFAGVKLVAGERFHIEPLGSVAFIVAVLAIAVGASLWARRRARPSVAVEIEASPAELAPKARPPGSEPTPAPR